MVTGDNIETASAIARQCGILDASEGLALDEAWDRLHAEKTSSKGSKDSKDSKGSKSQPVGMNDAGDVED